jgi:hypothetical protein
MFSRGDTGKNEQLKSNVAHLPMSELSGLDLIAGKLTFRAFAEFFHRYGCLTRPGKHIAELIAIISPSTPQACFYNGICFRADRRAFEMKWKEATEGSWAFIEGDEHGAFDLIVKPRGENGMACARRISVNPTIEDRYFIFEEQGHTIATWNDFRDILFLLFAGEISRVPPSRVAENHRTALARLCESRRLRTDAGFVLRGF